MVVQVWDRLEQDGSNAENMNAESSEEKGGKRLGWGEMPVAYISQ